MCVVEYSRLQKSASYLLLYGCDFLFRQRASIIQTRKNILSLQRWKVLEKILNGISIRKHAHNLMNRDSSPFNACFSMTDIWINRYSVVHPETIIRLISSHKQTYLVLAIGKRLVFSPVVGQIQTGDAPNAEADICCGQGKFPCASRTSELPVGESPTRVEVSHRPVIELCMFGTKSE